MGVTTTPINGFTLPDDNELLRNVYFHVRNHAAQLEAALRSRGLTSSDVTGYLDLLGRVNTLEARPSGAGTRQRAQVTAGSVSLPADGAWAVPVSGGSAMASIVLPAVAGDWLDLGISYAAVNEVGDLRVDFATYNGATLVNYVSGTGSAGHGLVGFGSIGGRYETGGGQIPYQVQAADVISGNVTIKVLMKATGGVRSVFANATDPLLIWGKSPR